MIMHLHKFRICWIIIVQGECLNIDDVSGYWSNLTDLNPTTCVTTPRSDEVKPLLEMKLNLTCLLGTSRSLEFNLTHPSVNIHFLTNIIQCNEEMFFFTKKLTVCESETIKDCTVRSVDGGCQFRCECEPLLDTCHMYLAQRLDPPYFSSVIKLCDMNITRIFWNAFHWIQWIIY